MFQEIFSTQLHINTIHAVITHIHNKRGYNVILTELHKQYLPEIFLQHEQASLRAYKRKLQVHFQMDVAVKYLYFGTKYN